MIDIHTHILPCLDDGSQSMEESIAMAKAAIKEGIHTVIATPHHANGQYINEANTVIKATEHFVKELEQQEIPLLVVPGQEIRFYDNLLNDLEAGHILTLNNSAYVLIELPSRSVPRGMRELIHELTVMGLTTIIAHPERNAELAKHPERLGEWIKLGALAQVTGHSLTGLFGPKVRQTALNMCRQYLIHFVASDAHNLTYRGFGLGRAYQLIERELGADYLHLFQTNADNLIKGDPCIGWEMAAPRKKRFYFF